MASVTKVGNIWRAQIARTVGGKSVRKSATFATKAQAQVWAAQIDAEILSNKHGQIPNKTFGELLNRYLDEVSPQKRGKRWEKIKIDMFNRQEIGSIKLSKLDAAVIAKWRDDRLKEVSSATVRREWNLLSSACNTAVKEWGWLKANPMKDVKRPADGDDRTRRVSEKEIEKLMFTLGWDTTSKPATTSALIALIFCFAIETAMRAGEILSLEWTNVDLKNQTAHLPKTKNGHARTVPLSTESVRLLKLVKKEGRKVFNISSSTLDSTFRKCRNKALIKDLHFHDTRREALSRISKKLDPFQLAKMSGHRDMRILLNVYYQEDPSVTAKLLG